MKPTLSIIVPYRDRREHLRRFLPHIQRYFDRDKLDKDIPYSITIVEQANRGEFNVGLLRNAGYAETRDRHDYFCFHDVDYLPIWADYSYCDNPARLVWHGADRRPRADGEASRLFHNYELFFGAVVSLPGRDFERVNGYSNAYFGWGSEDSDLRERCLGCGLEITKRDGTFDALGHENRGYNADMTLTDAAIRNRRRFVEQLPLLRSGQRDKWDGLSNLSYKLLETIDIEPVPGLRPPFSLRMLRIDFTLPASGKLFSLGSMPT